MEYGFVMEPSTLESLTTNLSETYLAIAEGLPGTCVHEGKGFRAATNPFEHPICNFAVCDDSPEVDAESLRSLAAGKPHFNVYVVHGSGERAGEQALLDAGFSVLHGLAEMACEEVNDGPQIDLREALLLADRMRVAEFMSWQFFSTQTDAVRTRIAGASASGRALKLFEAVDVKIRQKPFAAVMLHPTAGALGLYNLCVSMPYRSRGIGSRIVRSAQSEAQRTGKVLVLQCDARLEGWYARLGLRRVGDVTVYGDRSKIAI